MLVTSVVSGLIVAGFSSFVFAVAGSDTNATAVFAAIAATIARSLAADPESATRTILATLILGALAGGVTLFLIGQSRMGRWIRFIPYPIVAGFLAATGWLLVTGALRVVSGFSVTRLVHGVTVTASLQLLAAAVIAGTLLATRRIKHPLLMPALLFGAGIVLDIVSIAAYGGIGPARAAGWFLPALAPPVVSPAWSPATFADVDWGLVVTLLPGIATAVCVITISILFGAAGLEVQTGTDADLDRELRTSGLASILSGLCGGNLGVLSSSRTLVNFQAGARSRFSGILVAAISFLALVGGSTIVSAIPRPLLGGLLLFLGCSLLYDWVVVAWLHVSKMDVVLILAIVVITALDSFVAALAVGLVFACINFVVRYGRHRVVKHSLTGANKRSRVERSAVERRLLDEHGAAVRILSLQGFIFFGTANSVLEEARRHVTAEGRRLAGYLVLDFEGTTGFDTSAAHSFAKIEQLAARCGTAVIYCGVPNEAYGLLERAGVAFTRGSAQNAFTDLDHALEACEDRVLDEVAAEPESIEAWLARELNGSDRAERLLSYFDDVQVRSGESLFRQGDPSDSVYLVAVGRLRVAIDDEGSERRLRSMAAGSFIGEMGLFSNEPRSASVVAEGDALLYRLSAAALERMTTEEPALANAFHALLFRLAAERLRFASAEIAALQA